MFKILVFQALYNLSDDAMEFQVRDRLSFRRFLGLSLEAKVPDAKTIWLTEASVHDSNVFEELIDPCNSSKDVYADSAYRGHEKIPWLDEQGYRPKIQRKGYRGKPITWWEKQGNRTRFKVRSWVEHVLGAQAMKTGNLIVRAIGKARASTAIGLRNLAYNIVRFSFLMMKSGAISVVPK